MLVAVWPVYVLPVAVTVPVTASAYQPVFSVTPEMDTLPKDGAVLVAMSEKVGEAPMLHCVASAPQIGVAEVTAFRITWKLSMPPGKVVKLALTWKPACTGLIWKIQKSLSVLFAAGGRSDTTFRENDVKSPNVAFMLPT